MVAHDQMMRLHMRLLIKHGLHQFNALLVCVQVGQRVEGVGCIIQPILGFADLFTAAASTSHGGGVMPLARGYDNLLFSMAGSNTFAWGLA